MSYLVCAWKEGKQFSLMITPTVKVIMSVVTGIVKSRIKLFSAVSALQERASLILEVRIRLFFISKCFFSSDCGI